MKYLILGAGPAGLSFANRLKQMNETSFLVLEHEAEAGGLCRSVDVDGAPFDIGGGHFLDVRKAGVNEFLFGFMPEEEWNKYERDSRIVINDNVIGHPIEANIWQMKLEDQVQYLKSIAIAGCNRGIAMPKEFTDWIYWKLGSKIAEDYMIPYNQKMFGNELNRLGTYWLEKLPDVSFEESLLSCLERKPYGTQPGHSQFYYPKKFGYGELWRRMSAEIKDNIEYKKTVKKINFFDKSVTVADGTTYRADKIISTIPWVEFSEIDGMTEELKDSLKQLKFSSVQTKYIPDQIDIAAHWIYYPDKTLPYHRILVRHNFCPNSKGYWTETNSERTHMEIPDYNFKYMNQYAYPLNTINKPFIMKKLLDWCKSKDVYGLGRWGEHQHYNSDVTVDLAIKLASNIHEAI